MDKEQVVKNLLERATVKVLLGQRFSGTGFFISPDYLLTAYHCIGDLADEDDIYVKNDVYGTMRVMLIHEYSFPSRNIDIAVLKLVDIKKVTDYVPLGVISEKHKSSKIQSVAYPNEESVIASGEIRGFPTKYPHKFLNNAMLGKGQSGGVVYHPEMQCAVGIALEIYSPDKMMNTGLAGRFDKLFLHWQELESLNKQSIEHWDKQLEESDKLLFEKPKEKPPTDSVISNLEKHQPRNRFFTGRADILEKLHHLLQQDHSVALYSVALNGIGGVGKTQTVSEYAYRYQHEYSAILWVLGESKETLYTHFANLTEVLGLPRMEKQEDNIAIVQNWLNTHDNWLIIIDNAETKQDLQAADELIPNISRGRRLFTTRTQAVGNVAEPIEIDCLEEITGGLLLVKRARIVQLSDNDIKLVSKKLGDKDWQMAQDISVELGGLPLALDHAGAYIEQAKIGLQDYLERYTGYTPQMLQFEAKGQYPRSVYVTFQMALEKVEKRDPLAGEVLRMCAFLHPDGIPTRLLNALSEENPLLLDKAMMTLNDYSLVKRIPERNLLTVHRVVQAVVKEVCDE
ncbi:MAG: NB-ARC domain-containing protein [Thiotrichaceae bacterium]|nr:NB-ARC domain-containing protein [Thiotrichaceae bacterium]